MHDTFDIAVADLWQSMGLPAAPAAELHSLQIADQTVHLTQRPAGHLLVFATLAEGKDIARDLADAQNLFTDDPLEPTVTYFDAEQTWLAWNRQPLAQCTVHAMQHQLECICACAERLADSPC